MIPIEERIKYTWRNMNVVTKAKVRICKCLRRKKHLEQQKQILKNVSGVAYPGELLAIMGSSGSGKTTLLNALTFQSASNVRVSGNRCVNGFQVTPKQLISRAGYVQQEDIFIGRLTVKEHLVFHALLRMDRHIPYKQRMERVNEVMGELGLIKCENTQIGITGRIKGISGGEKMRLSFAAEMLTNPKLMFCDEPTSGLDSYIALSVVQVLKNMAKAGKTIICTIHQPSSEVYAMFDKLLLMAEGRVAFMGSLREAEGFFNELGTPCPTNYNPADHYVHQLAIVPEKEETCRQKVAQICDKFEKSSNAAKIAFETSTTDEEKGYETWATSKISKRRYKASWCAQFRAVMWRSFLTVIRESVLIKVRLMQTIIIALLVGIVYYDQNLDQDGIMNINGAIFVLLTTITFQNVLAVIDVFCGELAVFLKEHRNGMYRTDVYFLCKSFADFPVFIVMPIFLMGICYFMIGLNSEGAKFYIAVGIMMIVGNVAISFGYLLSCISETVSQALSIGPPMLVPFLLFGGFLLNVKSIPIYFEWISYISWFRYGNAALFINQWKGVTGIKCKPGIICAKDGKFVLEIFSFKEDKLVWNIIMLTVLCFGYKLVAFCALFLKTFQSKV